MSFTSFNEQHTFIYPELESILEIITNLPSEREMRTSLMGLLSSLMSGDPNEIQDQYRLIQENLSSKPTYAQVLRRGL